MKEPSVWQGLDHDNILHAVEGTLGEKLSNLLRTRNSYINRVYELEKHETRERFIVKFYRPGRWTREMILEEHGFLKELYEKEIPVIPPVEIGRQTLFDLVRDPQSSVPQPPVPIYFALFPKKGGRPLDEFDEDTWEELGRLLARMHRIGAGHKKSSRITWRPSLATRHHLEVLYRTDYLLPKFKSSFEQAAEGFIKKADPFFDGQQYILLHGDLHKGNLIHRAGEGIFVVDLDDLCFGPPVQDLWMLLPGPPENCEAELERFIKGYKVFNDFDRSSLELIPWLRGMRIIHFISWLAVQSGEEGFSGHFPEAGKTRYWNELINELHGITSGS